MTFEAGWNAAIEKAAAKVDNLKAHLNMEEFLLVLRDKPKAAEIAKAVCSILDANAAAIRSLTLPSDLVAVPREPTPEMVDAGVSAPGPAARTWEEHVTVIYRAMLAAHEEG